MGQVLLTILRLSVLVLGTAVGLLGADLRTPQEFSFDPLLTDSSQPPPDKLKGYQEMRSVLTKKTTALMKKYAGENYWTTKLAPVVFDSLYSSFSATPAGQISLEGPVAILEGMANRLAANGKEELKTLSRNKFPDLPVVGNLAVDLAESQNVRFGGGAVHYNLNLKKRVAPEIKLGNLALSGGTETHLQGNSLTRRPVASIGYKAQNSSYQLQLQGETVRLDVRIMPVDLRLDWNPGVVQFRVNLSLGFL